jgi:hypothetical protein
MNTRIHHIRKNILWGTGYLHFSPPGIKETQRKEMSQPEGVEQTGPSQFLFTHAFSRKLEPREVLASFLAQGLSRSMSEALSRPAFTSDLLNITVLPHLSEPPPSTMG